MIRSLSDEKDVEILNFNKDLVNVVNENLENVQLKFIKDLEKIAESTGDSSLHKTIVNTEEAFRQLEKEKEIAEQKAKDEERKRKLAEEKAKKEEAKLVEAEQKAKAEEERRIRAELERKKEKKGF